MTKKVKKFDNKNLNLICVILDFLLFTIITFNLIILKINIFKKIYDSLLSMSTLYSLENRELLSNLLKFSDFLSDIQKTYQNNENPWILMFIKII